MHNRINSLTTLVICQGQVERAIMKTKRHTTLLSTTIRVHKCIIYLCSLCFGNIDDQCKGPSKKERDHLAHYYTLYACLLFPWMDLYQRCRFGWEFEKSVCQTCSCPSYEVQHDAIPQGPWEPIPEPEIWNCGLPRLHWIWTSGKSGRSHSVSFLSLLNLTTITVYQVLLFTCCLWFFIFGQWQKVESVQSFENSAKNIIFFRGNWDWTH